MRPTKSSRSRQWIAGLAVLLVVSGSIRPLAFAAGLGSLHGRVFESGGGRPRAGVVVALVGSSQEAPVYRSSPTDERGVFRVEGVPAGRYRVLVETAEGAFLATEPVDLEADSNRAVSLSLKAGSPGEGDPGKGTTTRWQKWVIVGAIAVGALLVLDALTEEERASPF